MAEFSSSSWKYPPNGGAGYKLYLVVNQSSQNATNNTSTCSWALYIIKDRSWNGFYAWNSESYKFQVDGSTIASNSGNLVSSPWTGTSSWTLGSGSFTVTHNADGNKTISLYADFVRTATSWHPGTMTVSGSLALTRIPKVPGAPGTPTATASSSVEGRVSLSWSAPSDNGGSTITGYKIYRASNNALLATTSGTGTSTNLSLTVGDNLAFYVRAVNAIGEGPKSSNSGSVLVNGNPTTPPTLSSLTNAGTTAAGTLIATWTASPAVPTAITGYTIELSSDNTNWLTWTDVSAATLSTTLTSITPNSIRYVRVRARNAFSDANSSFSAPSATLSATSSGPPSAPVGPPSSPGSPTASVTGIYNSVLLEWGQPLSTGNPSGISSYTVSWTSTSGNGTQTVSGATTSLLVENLVPGTLYNFSITAKNSLTSGGDGPSATVSATPLPDPSWEDSVISTDLILGQAYSQEVIRTQGGTILYSSSGTLPPGITFVKDTPSSGPNAGKQIGLLSGIPTTQGKYTFTLLSELSGVPGSTISLEFTVYVKPSSRRRESTSYTQTTIFKRFDGTQWVDVGTTDVGGSPIGLRKFDGTSWVQTTLPTL